MIPELVLRNGIVEFSSHESIERETVEQSECDEQFPVSEDPLIHVM